MSNSFAIETENLGRIYKLRGNKKEARKELIALSNAENCSDCSDRMAPVKRL
jgi:hypothetical protein